MYRIIIPNFFVIEPSNNPDIIFTNADKGNVTVAIKKQDYINKIEETLQNKNTYQIIEYNLINKITK